MFAPVPNGRGMETDSSTVPAAEQIISADSQLVSGPRSMVWQDCAGTGRVAGENIVNSQRPIIKKSALPGLWVHPE